jgi:anaerobic magnesium-protoporphyrin IX monomethyl ester cyclase
MGSISLITARGCPYHCEWCSHQVYGQTHRRRKPRFVADELEWLRKRYKPDMLWIADDVFTIHHGWLQEWREQVTSRSLHIPFECISRADRLTEEVIRTLAELGCFRLWIGSESGSQRILDRMKRGVTVEQVQRATKLCRDYGIQTGMFLMWGYEGEEMEDIEATIEHVRASKPDVFLTTVAYPIKGTPYFKREQEQGLIRETRPWAESSDRELGDSGKTQRRLLSDRQPVAEARSGVGADRHQWQIRRQQEEAGVSESTDYCRTHESCISPRRMM